MGELPNQPIDLSPSDQVRMPLGQQDARVLQPSSPSNALGWAPAPELPAREAEDQALLSEAMLHQPISKAREEPAPHMPPHEQDLIEADQEEGDPLGKVLPQVPDLSPNAEGAATQSPKHQPDREEASNAAKDPDQRADAAEDEHVLKDGESKGPYS